MQTNVSSYILDIKNTPIEIHSNSFIVCGQRLFSQAEPDYYTTSIFIKLVVSSVIELLSQYFCVA